LVSKSRYIIFFLLIGSITGIFGQSTNDSIIEGKVTDSSSGIPIHLVNVYLSGTTFGASTSQTGIYRMENIPGGSYQLIFQHIGYEIILKDILVEDNHRYVIDIRLLPKIYESEDIQVITTEPTEWKNQLKFFIKEFIGETKNSENCEIMNPEVLNFQINDESNEFIAYTDSIVRIKNHSLGYRINLVLVDFLCKNDRLSHYRIYPRFELLEARDEDEAEQWLENRQKTFIASIKHFLSTLARGKIREENFKLSTSVNINWLLDGYGNYVHGDSLKIIDTDRALYKKFFLDNYLKVSYLPVRINPPSIIRFNSEYIVIDTLGNILTPGAVLRSGTWFKHRVAETLPMEYLPNN
jgi:hypothetical protein